MEENKRIYRPKGRGYIISLSVSMLIFSALIVGGIVLISFNYAIAGAIILCLGAIAVAWEIIEVYLYKLVLTESGINLSENRLLASVRQERVTLSYDGLCEIKFTSAMGENGKTVPAIALFYSDGIFRFLNVNRFNMRQIECIMSDIKRLAEAKIGREVSILSFKKKGGYAILYPKE